MAKLHSVVMLDNCTIHYCEEAVQIIQEVGAIVHFLPPYSLDYNPIEEAFSKVKAEMKAMEKEAQVLDIETVVPSAFSCFTVSDCNQWIKDSVCLLYTSPSPRDQRGSRMPSSA